MHAQMLKIVLYHLIGSDEYNLMYSLLNTNSLIAWLIIIDDSKKYFL